jgi:hypothetical protein
VEMPFDQAGITAWEGRGGIELAKTKAKSITMGPRLLWRGSYHGMKDDNFRRVLRDRLQKRPIET